MARLIFRWSLLVLLMIVVGWLVFRAGPVSAQRVTGTPVRPRATSAPQPQPTEKEKSPTPWPTDTPTTSPTATATPTSTATATTTATATATSTATATATATPTATSTSTATATPTMTPTPFASTLVLNELLPNPRNTDWNRDGTNDRGDAWIELYNSSASPVDLTGWQLAGIDAHSVVTFTLPPDTRIAARGYRVFFASQTKIGLARRAGEVRLLYPNGSVADVVRLADLRDDQATARAADGNGGWVNDCVPSPDAPNCSMRTTLTSSFNLPYFRQHIASPSSLGTLNPDVLATNAFLALVLALAMGFFGNLINDAVESHEEQMRRVLLPIQNFAEYLRRIGTWVNVLLSMSGMLSWAGFALKLGGLLLIYGLVLAFLDPSFNLFDRDGWLLILALALSAGLVSLSDDVAQYLYLRWRGDRSVIRLHGGNLVLVILTTLFSRFSRLAPGLLIGSPAGIEQVDSPDFEVRSHLLGLGAMAVLAIAAWALTPFTSGDAWLQTLFLLLFAAAVQTLFFELLPLQYLHGRGLFQFNRVLWLVLFALTTTVFLQTMLNPEGAFVSAFQSPDMIVLALTVVAFCLFSVVAWFYLQHLDKSAPSVVETSSGVGPASE